MGDLALCTRSGEGLASAASERPTTEICLWIVRRLPNKTAPPVAYRAGPFWGASTPKVFVGKDLRQHDRSRGSGGKWAVDRVMQIPSSGLGRCVFFAFLTMPNFDSSTGPGQITN